MKIKGLRSNRNSPLLIENLGGKNSLGEPDGTDFFMSPEKAAQYLDVSVKFIYERIQSGELKAYSIGKRIKRIRRRVLEEWLSANAERQRR